MALTLRLSKLAPTFSSRFYSSPVLKSDKIKKTERFFTPVINLAQNLENLPKLQQNVELRKLELDTAKLKSLWDFLKHLRSTKSQLERRKIEVMNNIQDLKKIGNDSEVVEELTKLRTEWKMIKDDLKVLTTAFMEVEENVMIHGLMLPNELNENTPKEDKIIYEFGKVPQIANPVSHIDIGASLDLIDYRDPSCFYLKDEAALFEVSCAYYFADSLKKNDFISFCNPDSVRNIIVEACGVNATQIDQAVFTINEKIQREKSWLNYKLHLVGGASIYPFCAFHTKQTVCFSSLPIKYFTVGRQYSPSSLDSKPGLYDTWQKTTNEIFALTADDYDEMMAVFQQTLSIIISLYEKLGFHFRVVYVKASDLENWESLRASFQMYSCHERKYIEIGKISISGSYICQRLLMTYQMSEKDTKKRFMKMISGTPVNITKLLACILEQRSNPYEKFSMPDCLKSQWSV